VRKFIALASASLIAGVTLLGVGVAQTFAKTVTILVDGVPSQVEVVYGSVAEVLAGQGISLEPRDTVSPGLDEIVGDNTQIEVHRARQVTLSIDGRSGVYWTTATSVAEVVADLGLKDLDVATTHDLETTIGRDGILLGIDSAKDVVIVADGQTTELHAAGRVADALAAAGVSFDDDDILSYEPTQWLVNGLEIVRVRVDTEVVTRDVEIPYERQTRDNPDVYVGTNTVVTPGVPGVKSETVKLRYHDGVLAEETVLASVVGREPIAEVTEVGTKPMPVVVTGDAQAIAYRLLQERGWGDDEFTCLQNLWQRESGWRYNATNPYSGAYGIPQALPGSKMASAGDDWQTNPETQIIWGLGYIAGRYSTPCGAWGFFQSNNWY
jgi:uncharacterized protein YabE (DUF348 family)